MSIQLKTATLLVSAMWLSSCGTEGSTTTEPQAEPAAETSTPEVSAIEHQSSWQPEAAVFEHMVDVKGQTVAELMAENAYFATMFIDRGAKFIAISADQAALDRIEQVKKETGYSDDQLTTRLTTLASPGLTIGEADVAIVANNYGSISHRPAFNTEVRNGLKPGGRYYILGWLAQQTPIGPPMELRVPETQVMDELEPAGFTDIVMSTKQFPYHYMAIGQEYIENETE